MAPTVFYLASAKVQIIFELTKRNSIFLLLKAKIVEYVVFNVLTHSLYGLKIAKRPARAKALVINAFALAGRFVIGGLFPQGAALGYVLLPRWGVLVMTVFLSTFN